MRYLGNNTITINNHLMSFNDEGPDDGPVIILIHAFPLNKSQWNKQVEVLIENCRVIAYDIRGFGNSDSNIDNEEFSVELFVEDLMGLMDYLKLEKAMLCGLSLGGYIALNAAVNFPKRVDSLILCDTTCIADTLESKEKRMLTIKNIEKNGVESFANESIKNLFAPESFVTNKEKIAIVKEMIVKTSAKSLCNTITALSKRKETCSDLQKICVPVLILVGQEDLITNVEAANFMQKNIKGSELYVIEHAGHLSNIENSYEFNDKISLFISTVYHKSRD